MEAALDRLIGIATTISRYAGWLCGFLLLFAAVLISVDIFLRATFVITVGLAPDLSSHALAIASSWGCTVALLNRSHVRIDSVYNHLSGRARSVLDMVGLISFIYFMALVSYYAYYVLEQSIISNTHSVTTVEIPLAIPQFFWFVGFLFFLATATLLLLRAGLAILKNDTRFVHNLIGARSAQEEIELEKESLGTNAPGAKGAAQ